MKLKNPEQYDACVKALHALGMNPAQFCTYALAKDLLEVVNDPDYFDKAPTLYDVKSYYDDLAYDDFMFELEEAYSLLE